MSESNRDLRNQVCYYFTIALGFIGTLFVGIGLWFFLMQVFLWAKFGNWISLPFIDLFVASKDVVLDNAPSTGAKISTPDWHDVFPSFSAWLSHPQSWIGIHDLVKSILEWLPLTVGFAAIGLLIGYLSYSIRDAACDEEYLREMRLEK